MQFVCRVGTPEGGIRQEVHQAADASLLRRQLEQGGYHVFDVRAAGVLARLAELRLPGRSKRIPAQKLMVFNQELASLLRAGLPLLQSLELMLERADPDFRGVLSEVCDHVKSGEGFSDAVAHFEDVFPRLYASSIKAGERSGELESVIRRYLRYQKLVLKARRRVVSALVYPAALVVLSLAMMAVMLVYVVPRFSAFYTDLDAELPVVTRVIIGVSNGLRGSWWMLLLALAAGWVLLTQWLATDSGARRFDRMRLRLPIFGGVLHRMSLAEFCRALSTLLSGGIPLVAAMEVAVQTVGNRFIRGSLEPTIEEVREGKPFYASLERTGVVPDATIGMVKVGEATGGLDAMLSNAADFYDEEVETRLERILSLVEPVMLVFMGLVVATLLLAIYLPLFSVLSKVQF